MKKAERERRVSEVAELLELTEYLARKPGQLSGGQRQRVAMGRAIVREPKRLPDGRAALEPRREAARPDARRHRRAPVAARRDHRLRHARPGGGDDARPSRRRAQGRPAPAVRRAADALRAAGEHVRRGVHRLAVDEPARGAARAASGCSFCGVERARCRAALPTSNGKVVLGLRPESLDLAPGGIDARVEVVEEIGRGRVRLLRRRLRRRAGQARRPHRGAQAPEREAKVSLCPRVDEAHLFDAATGCGWRSREGAGAGTRRDRPPACVTLDVATPAAVVDLDRLEANLARWQEHCDRVGLANRPHVKTHKCVEIARRQVELGARRDHVPDPARGGGHGRRGDRRRPRPVQRRRRPQARAARARCSGGRRSRSPPTTRRSCPVSAARRRTRAGSSASSSTATPGSAGRASPRRRRRRSSRRRSPGRRACGSPAC